MLSIIAAQETSLQDNKILLTIVATIVGIIIGSVMSTLRGRIRTLDYTVKHDRIAISAEDAVFGSIQVTWQGHSVTNLFQSRVEFFNQSGKDFKDLKFKVYSGDTQLLGERTQIVGTPNILYYSKDFADSLLVPEGQTPTSAQFDIYRYSREYTVPILNRGQVISMTYLTVVPDGNAGPSVWLDVSHEGVQAKFRPLIAQIHGVPIYRATITGYTAAMIVLAMCGYALHTSWFVATACIFTGLFAQRVGAFMYRVAVICKSLLLS